MADKPKLDRSTRLGFGIPNAPEAPDSSERPTPPAPRTVVDILAVPSVDMEAAGAPDTLRGHGPAVTPRPPIAAPPVDAAEQPAAGSTVAPLIEVEYIRETDASAMASMTWPVLEIWTRNRIYHVDAAMQCVAVIDRATGERDEAHTLKGARLTGGQRQNRAHSAMEIVHPYPVPGMEAVFKHANRRHGQYGQTSTVERVVMRVRKFRVGLVGGTEPAWDEITGNFKVQK